MYFNDFFLFTDFLQGTFTVQTRFLTLWSSFLLTMSVLQSQFSTEIHFYAFQMLFVSFDTPFTEIVFHENSLFIALDVFLALKCVLQSTFSG